MTEIRPAALPELTVHVRTVTTVLWVGMAIVVGLGIAREAREFLPFVPGFVFHSRFFWLDGEANFPAWYSSALMLFTAALLYRQYRLAKATVAPRQGGWLFLATGFVLLSLDETAGFHEAVNVALVTARDFDGLLDRPWIFVGMPVVAIVVLLLLGFLLRLPARTRWPYVASGLLYFCGIFALESIGGVTVAYGVDSLAYRLTFITEETLELAGVTLFATATLRHTAFETGAFRQRYA